MEEVRCFKCKKLLFRKGKRIIDVTGINEEIKKQIQIKTNNKIEIKCDRCKELNTFEV